MSIDLQLNVIRGSFNLNVDLQLPANTITAVLGPSGCGKTTLLRAIAGLEVAPHCKVKINQATWQDTQHCLPVHKRNVGYVFQDACLFNHLNVMDNVQYGFSRLDKSSQRIGVHEIIQQTGIQHLLNRQVQTLSGGEKQRIAIARALAANPALLLMDEPVSSLDENSKGELLNCIESIHRQFSIPVVVVTHSAIEAARLADYLVLLENGKIKEMGETAELFSRLDLPLAQQQDAASIIHAEVKSHDMTYQLSSLAFEGGQLLLPGTEKPTGSRVKAIISARDVSLTRARQEDTSILNILPAEVDAITDVNTAQVTVRLIVGNSPLLARITRKSAEDLQLKSGQKVFAQVKSIAII